MKIVLLFYNNVLDLDFSIIFNDIKDAEKYFDSVVRSHLKNKCTKSDIDEYIKKRCYKDSNSFQVMISDV